MKPWIRLYSEIIDDPKVQLLEPDHFRMWINFMCLASDNGGKVELSKQVSWRLRVSDDGLNHCISVLTAAGLLDEDDAGGVWIHNWKERQFESDDQTSRSRQWRKKQKTDKPEGENIACNNDATLHATSHATTMQRCMQQPSVVACNNFATASDTDTDTDKHMSIAEATDGGDFGDPAPGKHPSRFAEFWDLYPRKDGKAAAEKLYRSQATSPAKAESIIAALRHQVPGLKSRDPQYRPHARTWLSQRRWEDDAAEPEPTGEEYEFEYQKPFPFDKIKAGERGPDFPSLQSLLDDFLEVAKEEIN